MVFSDIDECATKTHVCKNKANCRNTLGNHTCFCPEGQTGNGTKEGGCQQVHPNATPIVLPTVLGKQLSMPLHLFFSQIGIGDNRT
jgi:hypothetical protein